MVVAKQPIARIDDIDNGFVLAFVVFGTIADGKADGIHALAKRALQHVFRHNEVAGLQYRDAFPCDGRPHPQVVEAFGICPFPGRLHLILLSLLVGKERDGAHGIPVEVDEVDARQVGFVDAPHVVVVHRVVFAFARPKLNLCTTRVAAMHLPELPRPQREDKGRAKEDHSHCQAEHRDDVLRLVLHQIAPTGPDGAINQFIVHNA